MSEAELLKLGWTKDFEGFMCKAFQGRWYRFGNGYLYYKEMFINQRPIRTVERFVELWRGITGEHLNQKDNE